MKVETPAWESVGNAYTEETTQQSNNTMHTLTVIHAINNRPRVRRDNFSRDSSACFARGGAVIHSGIHRSTAFIHAERHPEAFQALQYWKRNQKSLNGFIVGLIESDSLEVAEATAFLALFPSWKLTQLGKGGNASQVGGKLVAWRYVGKLRVSCGAGCFSELVAKVRKLQRKTT